jgi:hypothetical protein
MKSRRYKNGCSGRLDASVGLMVTSIMIAGDAKGPQAVADAEETLESCLIAPVRGMSTSQEIAVTQRRTDIPRLAP